MANELRVSIDYGLFTETHMPVPRPAPSWRELERRVTVTVTGSHPKTQPTQPSSCALGVW
jgi:hypothetical protein